jgi:hypothetical protein
MALPAAAATPQKEVSGANGMVGILNSGGVNTQFNVTKFNFKWGVTLDKTTNSGNAGWQSSVAGVSSLNGTLSFVYDLANNPNISPQQIIPGTIATLALIADGVATANTQLGSDVLGTETWAGPAIFGELTMDSGPQSGANNCSVTFESQGAWTHPTA